MNSGERGEEWGSAPGQPLRIALSVVLLLCAYGVLQWLVDGGLGIGWPHNVVRNWEQIGFSATHGQLVINPGGYRGVEAPEVYRGHLPVSLYPVFAVKRLFAWTGLRTFPFYVLLAGAVFFSVWFLFGRGQLGLLGAALAVLSPGYLVWPTILDPNTNTVLWGVVYAACLWWILDRPRLDTKACAFLFLATAAVSALNWTTALVHAQIFFWLIARRTPWRRVALYTATAAALSAFIVILSLGAKVAGAGGQAISLREALAGYTWGAGGYGNAQTASQLLRRVVFINGLALFPLWLLWSWRTLRVARLRGLSTAGLASLPVIAAAAEVFTLRNYFCQHPWMAAPVFLLGAVLSLSVTCQEESVEPGGSAVPASRRLKPVTVLSMAGAFCFGLLVIILNREYKGATFSMASLVRSHTSRTDPVAVVAEPPLSAFEITNRLCETLDRFLVPVVESPSPRDCVPARFVLSAKPISDNAWALTGSTADAGSKQSALVSACFRWFQVHITRRRKGDALDLGRPYYLYRASASGPVPGAQASTAAPTTP